MPTFEAKALSHLSTWKASRTKTVGTTVHDVHASEPVTPGDAGSWFVANVGGVGSDYPGTSGGVLPCVEVECEAQDQTRMLFRVTRSYDSSIEALDNPLAEPVTYEYDPETFDEPYYKDKSSTPKYARHTNGVRFATLPTRQSSLRTIVITKNVAHTVNMGSVGSLQDTVNDAAVTLDGESYGPRTLLVAKVGLSKIQRRNGVQFKTVTAIVKWKRDTWDQKFESMGVMQLDGGVLKPILDSNNVPVAEPWPLDAAGAKAASLASAGYEIVMEPYDKSASLAAIT